MSAGTAAPCHFVAIKMPIVRMIYKISKIIFIYKIISILPLPVPEKMHSIKFF